MIRYAKNVLNDFLLTVYPENCYNCSEILLSQEQYLCTSCLLQLPRTNYHIVRENPLFLRFAAISVVRQAFAFITFNQKGVAQTLLHQLKYKNKPGLGNYLGELYGQEIAPFVGDYDFIMPVPMTKQKRKRRGYNQSELIAEGLAKPLEIEVRPDVVRKTQVTESQTRKGKVERWKNVSGVFHVENPEEINGKNILLCDDVITTGATVGALCEQLVRHKVKSVGICAVATGIK